MTPLAGRRVIVGLALLGRLAAPARAGDRALDPAADKALGGIRPEALRAHVRFLADDLLEGRGTGTRGGALAALYVATELEALGLEPAGDAGGYLQSVPLASARLAAEDSSLALVRSGGETPLALGRDALLAGDPLREETTVSAPLVFVGFGITAPELGYDSYAGTDARGKIAVVVSGAPARFPDSQRAHYSSRNLKRDAAAAHGAVGLLTLRTPADEGRAPWERVVRMADHPRVSWLDERGVPQDVRPEIQLVAALGPEATARLFEGAPRSLDQALAALKAGGSLAFDLPGKMRARIVSRHSRLEGQNVVAVLPGSDPRLEQEYVVVSAHLDHLGVGAPVDGDAIYNGALDNASGTATLLEVARAFASLPHPPPRSLLFLATTGEELGLLGSDYFAHRPTVPLEGLVADVNLDGVLMLHPLLDVVAFGAEHSSLGRAVSQAARRLGLALSPDPMPEQAFFIRSDHYSFVRQGVPSVFLFEGLETGDPKTEGGVPLRSWLRTRYHSPKDDMDQPIDFEAGARFAQVNFLIGYRVATERSRPTWNRGDFFGETFGPRGGGRTGRD